MPGSKCTGQRKSYNKTLNFVRNLLHQTNANIPITWLKGMPMQKNVREMMDACPPECINDIENVRDEVKNVRGPHTRPRSQEEYEKTALTL